MEILNTVCFTCEIQSTNCHGQIWNDVYFTDDNIHIYFSACYMKFWIFNIQKSVLRFNGINMYLSLIHMVKFVNIFFLCGL